jgi:hypothetical protein
LLVPGGWKLFRVGDGELMVDVDSYSFDYVVVRYGAEDNPETAATSVEGMRGTDKITITGLTNGIAYYFWIQARTDAGGESDWSDSVSGTPHIAASQIVELLAGDGSIELDWGLVSSADSYEVSYEVWYYESASGSAPGAKAADGLESGPYAITGLENGKEYAVYVKAKTPYDERTSGEKTAVPHTVPAAPAAPALTPGIAQIEASWTKTDMSVTSWEIWYHTANDRPQAKKYDEVSSTSVTIWGLADNTTYYVWLRAKNSDGASFYSDPASGTTPAIGAITVGLDGSLITVKNGNGTDVSGGFVLGSLGSATLSADDGFTGVAWYVDGGLLTGNPITLNGASYNDYRDHSVTFTGKKGGILYSSDPIPFRVTP